MLLLLTEQHWYYVKLYGGLDLVPVVIRHCGLFVEASRPVIMV